VGERTLEVCEVDQLTGLDPEHFGDNDDRRDPRIKRSARASARGSGPSRARTIPALRDSTSANMTIEPGSSSTAESRPAIDAPAFDSAFYLPGKIEIRRMPTLRSA